MQKREEAKLKRAGFLKVIGIDEAGRGPWAGPVTVAGVILNGSFCATKLRDSKKLTQKRREELFSQITRSCEYFVEQASNKEIDAEGIFIVIKKLARRIAKKSGADFVLLDAFNIQLPGVTQKAVIRGDEKIASIAAASIVAKVTRDRLMSKLAKRYRGYGLEKHKGYGTQFHQEALKKLGPSEIHRSSFGPIKSLLISRQKQDAK